MKKYGSYFIILICALLFASCAPEPEVIYESVGVEVTRIVEVPVNVIQEVIVIETVEVPVEVLVTPAVNFPTPVPADQLPLTRFGDGIWLIGTEIERGIYKNIGPVGVGVDGYPMCEWRIAKCFGGYRCTRDRGYTSYYYMVKFLYSDVTFATERCGEWIKVD